MGGGGRLFALPKPGLNTPPTPPPPPLGPKEEPNFFIENQMQARLGGWKDLFEGARGGGEWKGGGAVRVSGA